MWMTQNGKEEQQVGPQCKHCSNSASSIYLLHVCTPGLWLPMTPITNFSLRSANMGKRKSNKTYRNGFLMFLMQMAEQFSRGVISSERHIALHTQSGCGVVRYIHSVLGQMCRLWSDGFIHIFFLFLLCICDILFISCFINNFFLCRITEQTCFY